MIQCDCKFPRNCEASAVYNVVWLDFKDVFVLKDGANYCERHAEAYMRLVNFRVKKIGGKE